MNINALKTNIGNNINAVSINQKPLKQTIGINHEGDGPHEDYHLQKGKKLDITI